MNWICYFIVYFGSSISEFRLNYAQKMVKWLHFLMLLFRLLSTEMLLTKRVVAVFMCVWWAVTFVCVRIILMWRAPGGYLFDSISTFKSNPFFIVSFFGCCCCCYQAFVFRFALCINICIFNIKTVAGRINIYHFFTIFGWAYLQCISE